MHPAVGGDSHSRKRWEGVQSLTATWLLLWGVLLAYGILLKGKAKVKCGFCSGVGFQHRGYDMHTCRVCGGKGFVSRVEVAERVLARFKQPKIYRVSHEHSDVLRYEGYVWDEVYMALQVLSVSGIKCQLTFPI